MASNKKGNPRSGLERGVDRARFQMQMYGADLLAHRKGAELTIRALAADVDIPAHYLTWIENARMIPTVEQQEILRQWLLKHPLPIEQKDNA